MDPNAALARFRALMWEATHAPESIDKVSAACEAALVMQQLDNWLSNGGFKPNAWCYSLADAIQKHG